MSGRLALYGIFVSGIRQNLAAPEACRNPSRRLINHLLERPEMACRLHYPGRDQEWRPVRVGSPGRKS